MFSQNAQFLIIVSIEHAFMHQVRSSIRSFPGGNTQHRIQQNAGNYFDARMFSVCMNQFKEHPDGHQLIGGFPSEMDTLYNVQLYMYVQAKCSKLKATNGI